MEQLLIVHGPDTRTAADVFAHVCRLLEGICHAPPSAVARFGGTCVAKFAPVAKEDSGIVESQRGWAAGAGTWFCGDGSGAAALSRLPAAEDLDGCFAVACGDRQTGSFRLMTDRLGRLHVYGVEHGGCVVVCTSALALAALTDAGLDAVACREFLATGTVFEDRSLFSDVRKFAPALTVEFDGGRQRSRTRYWRLEDVLWNGGRSTAGLAEVADALQEWLERIARLYPNPVLDLTGGYDSRTLFGAMLRTAKSFSTVVVGHESDADVTSAARIAAEFGVEHLRLDPPDVRRGLPWPDPHQALALCDGECDLFEYSAIAALHRGLSPVFDISLNGSGGEIAKGYWWELLFPYTGQRGHFEERRVAAGRFAFDTRASDLLVPRSNLVDHFADIIRRANAGLENYRNTARMDNVYLTLRMQRWQGRITSATSRIWPCLSPFLMREPMELILSLPAKVRVRHRFTRRLIEYLNPRLARLPLAQGYPALPVRPGTLIHFRPLLEEAFGKIRRRLSSRRPAPATGQSAGELFELAGIAGPACMQTQDLYSRGALNELFQTKDPSRQQIARRVISLELALRGMRSVAKDFAVC